MRVADVLVGAGRPVVFHANLARALGSIPAALMLAQLLHWQDRAEDPDGWVWKVEEEWDAELALSPKQVKNARTVLVELGLMEHARRGMPARPHYRVDLDALDAWWSDMMGPKGRTRPTERAHHDSTKGPVLPIYKDDFKDDSKEVALFAPRFSTLWSTYPARDGKKVGKAKAEVEWNKLSVPERERAIVGARHLADAIAAGGKFGPPDAHRWLSRKEFEDWQEPAQVNGVLTGADRTLPAAQRWLERQRNGG